MVGHEQRRGSRELHQSPKVEQWIVTSWQMALGQLQLSEEITRLVLRFCPATADVNDADLAPDKLRDQVRIHFFHLIKIHQGIIVKVGGVDLDADELRTVEYLGDGIN